MARLSIDFGTMCIDTTKHSEDECRRAIAIPARENPLVHSALEQAWTTATAYERGELAAAYPWYFKDTLQSHQLRLPLY